MAKLPSATVEAIHLYRQNSREGGYKPRHRDVYRKIANGFMSFLASQMMDKYKDILLPLNLGKLCEIELDARVVYNEDGSINFAASNLSKNWKKTRELWNEFPETYGKKFIYFTQSKKPIVVWRDKYTHARYKNLFHFKAATRLSRHITKRYFK